jgi:hypothetical protein
VTSGIRDTVHTRYDPIANKAIPNAIKKTTRFTLLFAKAIVMRHIDPISVPGRMIGIYLPIFASILSDSVPIIGSRINARILSTAIICPIIVSPMVKVLCSILGTKLS